MLTSPDGLEWNRIPLNWGQSGSIIWTGTRFLLGHDQGIAHSTDGTAWTDVPLRTVGPSAIACLGKVYAAVGYEGIIYSSEEDPPNSALPSKRVDKAICIRSINGVLKVALPYGRDASTRATLYSLAGKRLADRAQSLSSEGIEISLAGMDRGAYLLEIRGSSVKSYIRFNNVW